MGFLSKLGLQRKKKAYAPFTSDKARKDAPAGFFNKNFVYKLILVTVFLILVIALYPRTQIQETAFSIGEPWRDDDLTAPFTFSLLKEDAELQAEIRGIRENTNPIFLRDSQAENRSKRQLDTLFHRLELVLEAYSDWQESRMLESEQQTLEDSLFFIRTRNRSGIGLDDNALMPLLEKYAEERFFVPSGVQGHRSIKNELREFLANLLDLLITDGIIDISREGINTQEITIRNVREHTERETSIRNVRTLREARDFARNRLSRQFELDLVRTATQILNLDRKSVV